jgi:WD40 repeat protein
VVVRDAQKGRLRFRLPHDGAVNGLAFGGPEGTWLASASEDKTVRLWDVRTGKLLRTIGAHEDATRDLVFSADGRLLATAGWDEVVRLWDATTGQEIEPAFEHHSGIWAVALSPDGRRLATAAADGIVRVWRATP